ncbi:unnamed protein product [Calypogeia fissa]
MDVFFKESLKFNLFQTLWRAIFNSSCSRKDQKFALDTCKCWSVFSALQCPCGSCSRLALQLMNTAADSLYHDYEHFSQCLNRADRHILHLRSSLLSILSGGVTALDIGQTVMQFRYQRNGMVQTKEQYRFIYEVLVDELKAIVRCYQ